MQVDTSTTTLNVEPSTDSQHDEDIAQNTPIDIKLQTAEQEDITAMSQQNNKNPNHNRTSTAQKSNKTAQNADTDFIYWKTKQTSNATDKNSDTTSTADPITKNDCNNFVVDADFIYWTARQDGLPYVFSGIMSTNPITGADPSFGTTDYVTPLGREYYVTNNLRPGFKAGVGFDLKRSGWDSYLEYTWMRANTTGSVNQEPDLSGNRLFPVFLPLPSHNTPASFFDSAQGSWSLRFNVCDWELGRCFFVSPKLSLRPHIGLKGTWQRQIFIVKLNNSYNIEEQTGSRIDLGYYKTTFNQFYWGVGVRSGLDTTLQFTPTWSIFGDFALSALWGNFHMLRQDITSNIDTSTPTDTSINATVINAAREFHSIRAVLELALGLRWDFISLDGKNRFRIQTGWEEQIWLDQNNYATINNLIYDNTNSALILQGLTVKFRFDF